MKTYVSALLFSFIVGCGSDETPSNAGPATPSSTGPNDLVEEPTKRAPPMRTPIQCCADLKLEKAVAAYTQAGAQLTSGSLEEESHAQLITSLAGVTKNTEDFTETVILLKELDLTDISRARQIYGDLSEVLIPRIEASSSASGSLDLAFGYSREADRHWAQEGVDPKSPYGDGIHSYSWGTRNEVQTSDKAEEERLGNTNLGPTP